MRIVKKFIDLTSYLLYFIFPPKLFFLLKSVFNRGYSRWISNAFNTCGSAFIQYPMYLRGGEYIKLGTGVDIDQRLRLEAYDEFLGDRFTPLIKIGDNVSIQKDCHIGAINSIVIGDNVLLASKVYISDHSHGEITREALNFSPAKRKLFSKGEVVIEDNVWLGEGVVVLPNVTIGKNCIVGANAVVTKSFPENCVIGGNPAKILRVL